MSWDVSLSDAETGACVEVERFEEGGTYVLGGSTYASLNITYNYSAFYYEHLDQERGLKWLDGKRGAETIERLEYVVAALGTTPDRDYWAKTPGNAGRALAMLLSWARQYPDAVWDVC